MFDTHICMFGIVVVFIVAFDSEVSSSRLHVSLPKANAEVLTLLVDAQATSDGT